MRILINVSNLRVGGGLQVADSVCRELYKYPQHQFVVVYPSVLTECAKAIESYNNIETCCYNLPISFLTILTGRDKVLDSYVRLKHIDAVLTIFGPSRWKPGVPHLSGFARSHLVLVNSPYWQLLNIKKRFLLKTKLLFLKYSFSKSADNYFTENLLISDRLGLIFPKKKIYTVTNNVNQIFYQPDLWDRGIILPTFDGLTLLTVAANYPHKNLPIIIPTCHYLEKHYPKLRFRFVLTISEKDSAIWQSEIVKRHVVFLGPVKISQCPYLYQQADVMLLPTLLECFSASYAEAMVMQKPILTSDLDFARSLCGDAALYYEATSPEQLGESINRLANDKKLGKLLVSNGLCQFKKFDTYEQRTKKLISILEGLVLNR